MNERDMKPVSGIEQRRFVAFLRLLQPWAMAIVLALLIDVFLRSILAGLIPYDPPTFATPGTPILHGSQFHRARLGLLLVTPISLLCSIFLDRYALAFGSQDTTSQHTAAKDMSEDGATILGQSERGFLTLATSIRIVLTAFMFRYWYYHIRDIWVYYAFYGLTWDPIYIGWKHLLSIAGLASGYVIVVEPFHGISLAAGRRAIVTRWSFVAILVLSSAVRATIYLTIYAIFLWFASAPMVVKAASWFWFFERESGPWWSSVQTPCIATIFLVVLAAALAFLSRALRRGYSNSR